jgi:hypothetical protein
MRVHRAWARAAAAVVTLYASIAATATGPSAQDVVAKVYDADPWGLGNAAVTARAMLADKNGTTSTLAFEARSHRYDPPFSKTIIRFSAPADLSGAGFLQIQNRSQDDDRFLFLPDLKRSRRISGSLRGSSFMGTDFSFADLDRRDLRECEAVSKPDEDIAGHSCFHVDILPRRSDSPYSHVEMWIQKDNYLPLKMLMFDRARVHVKSFAAEEVRRVSNRWFISKSKMVDDQHSHSTELVLDSIAVTEAEPDEEFTVRNLEKL